MSFTTGMFFVINTTKMSAYVPGTVSGVTKLMRKKNANM